MIIKLIDNSEQESVEKVMRHYTVEAESYRVDIRFFNNHKEYEKFLNEIHGDYYVPFRLFDIEDGGEVLIIQHGKVKAGSSAKNILAQKCQLFVMNNDGKTIDKYLVE